MALRASALKGAVVAAICVALVVSWVGEPAQGSPSIAASPNVLPSATRRLRALARVPRAQMYLSAGTAALRAAMPAAMIEGRLDATATTYVTDTARALQALHTMRACLQSSSRARTLVKKAARAKK